MYMNRHWFLVFLCTARSSLRYRSEFLMLSRCSTVCENSREEIQDGFLALDLDDSVSLIAKGGQMLVVGKPVAVLLGAVRVGCRYCFMVASNKRMARVSLASFKADCMSRPARLSITPPLPPLRCPEERSVS